MNFKKAFTLLELLIGFSILLLVGSVSTVWIYQKVQQERFFSQVDRMQKSVNLCKKISRISEENIRLFILQNKKELQYEVEGKSEFFPTKKNLIQDAYFTFKENEIANIVIEFQPNGTYYPKGILEIYSNKKKFKKKISF